MSWYSFFATCPFVITPFLITVLPDSRLISGFSTLDSSSRPSHTFAPLIWWEWCMKSPVNLELPARMLKNCLLFTKTLSLVMRYSPTTMSCTTEMMGDDSRGEMIWVGTDASDMSSCSVWIDCGTCMFISSPS